MLTLLDDGNNWFSKFPYMAVTRSQLALFRKASQHPTALFGLPVLLLSLSAKKIVVKEMKERQSRYARQINKYWDTSKP